MDRTITLSRQPSTKDGTFGDWVSDSNFSCKTIEKPWLDNAADESCIPCGRYFVLWQWSAKHNCNLYHLQNVPNRTAVEIHPANLQIQLLGCIAPGNSISTFSVDSIKPGIPSVSSTGVTSSVETLSKLEKDLQDDQGNQLSFWLTIKDA